MNRELHRFARHSRLGHLPLGRSNPRNCSRLNAAQLVTPGREAHLKAAISEPDLPRDSNPTRSLAPWRSNATGLDYYKIGI